MPFTTQSDIKIYHELKGRGNNVLYIGGTGADLRTKPNVLDSPLAKTHQVLTFDQRGLGQTEKPLSDYTMLEYANDAVQLMDELGWETADVIGTSFGGMVALNLAVQNPARVNKMVLCCTSPGGPDMASYPLHHLPETWSPADKIRNMMSTNDQRLDDNWQAANAASVEEMIKVSLSKKPEDHQRPEFKAGAKRQLMARAEHNVVEALPDIHIPTLICAGKYDGIAPVKNQEYMREKMPDAKLVWFEGGHLFMIQDKSAWTVIIDFLAQR